VLVLYVWAHYLFLLYSLHLPGYNELNALYRAYQPRKCFDRRYSNFILQVVHSLFPIYTHWRHIILGYVVVSYVDLIFILYFKYILKVEGG